MASLPMVASGGGDLLDLLDGYEGVSQAGGVGSNSAQMTTDFQDGDLCICVSLGGSGTSSYEGDATLVFKATVGSSSNNNNVSIIECTSTTTKVRVTSSGTGLGYIIKARKASA